MKKVLAILAHPDDCELKCYGTLRKYIEKHSYSAKLIIVCDGNKGVSVKDKPVQNLSNIRLSETINALKDSGIELETLNYEDGCLQLNNDLISPIELKIKEFDPDIVITHYNDLSGVDHQDHSIVSKAVINCVSRIDGINKLLLCEPLMTLRSAFIPNYFVDITDYFEDKLKALSMHNSQKGRFYLEKEYHSNKHEFYASSISYNAGKNNLKFEAFQLIFARE